MHVVMKLETTDVLFEELPIHWIEEHINMAELSKMGAGHSLIYIPHISLFL